VESIDTFTAPDSADLMERDQWIPLGNDRYLGVRYRFIVVKRRSENALNGPLLSNPKLSKNSEYKLGLEQITTNKRIEELQGTVQRTFSAKTAAEVSSRISGEIQASITPSAKLMTEALGKLTAEVSLAAQQTLATKVTYEVENVQKLTRELTLKASTANDEPARSIRIFLGFWEWHWDFYLYDIQHLNLRFKEEFLWWDVQRSFEQSADPEPLRLPLFSIRFYEPDADISVLEIPYNVEVKSPQMVTNLELTEAMPDVRPEPEPNLEELARAAFPTRAERREAQRKGGPKKKAGARKAAPKKALAKKKAAARKAGPARNPGSAKKKAGRKAARASPAIGR
jgi:hypothetical protein